MARVLLRLAVTALAVWLAAVLFPGFVTVKDPAAAVFFSIILALLNALVRPVLFLLTLPLTVLTLGLFIIVLNALVFWLATLVPVGVEVNGFLGALLGALTVSLVSLVTSRFVW